MRSAWSLSGLALLAVGLLGDSASASRLDKSACLALAAERAAAVADGVRADMTQGPERASANLTPERLRRIKRLIEVEEQIEFRCGRGSSLIAGVPAGAAPVRTAPEPPERKPPSVANAGPKETSQPAPSPPVSEAKASTETAAKPVAAAAAGAQGSAREAGAEKPPAATAAKPASPGAASPSEGAAEAKAPVRAARKKSPRRQSSSAYVSPADVSPYSILTRHGSAQ